MLATTAAHRSSSRTSSAHAAAVPPASTISSATAAAPSSVTSVTATERALVGEEVRGRPPMPLAAPVTTTTRPCDGAAAGRQSEGSRRRTVPSPRCSLGTGARRLARWAHRHRAFACIPLGISLWALLDAAHRPEWAWALAGRRRVVWMAVILFGVFTVVGGLLISGYTS